MKEVHLAFIQPTKLVDINTIEGIIEGEPVIVERRLNNWNVRLRITLSGIVLHEIEPTENEKETFNQLLGDAHAMMGNEYELARQRVIKSPAFKALFG